LLAVTPEPTAGQQEELDAWRDFVRTLSETGERYLTSDGPLSNPPLAEGVRHLATSSICWLAAGFHAERDTGLYRLNDLLTPWGGPNADNVYLHAKIDDQGTYRLHGFMHSCEEFLLALRIGNMHQAEYGTLGEASATDLGIEPGGEVDIILSPSGEGGLAIPPGTRMLAIREYYYDWRPLEPATLILERLDGQPPGGGVVAALQEAADQVARSVGYWDEYMVTARARGRDNAFIPPRREPKGLAAMSYAFCFWSLQPDEALVVRLPEPDARYWSAQLYQLRWFEALDLRRQMSLNQTQAKVGGDGYVTIVLSGADPGVVNWLDTEGRPAGLLTLRCAWLSAPAPQAETELVKLADLDRVIDPAEPRLDPSGRAAQLAARRDHLRWRFRS
jgi:hypothetical protein